MEFTNPRECYEYLSKKDKLTEDEEYLISDLYDTLELIERSGLKDDCSDVELVAADIAANLLMTAEKRNDVTEYQAYDCFLPKLTQQVLSILKEIDFDKTDTVNLEIKSPDAAIEVWGNAFHQCWHQINKRDILITIDNV